MYNRNLIFFHNIYNCLIFFLILHTCVNKEYIRYLGIKNLVIRPKIYVPNNIAQIEITNEFISCYYHHQITLSKTVDKRLVPKKRKKLTHIYFYFFKSLSYT